ncbi:MP65 [Candida margitis]|uniref:MP65 n=1 Tax=Candida margitis TaxID=1775924 RepID=UPI002227589F|nr:MP65 [Candida margitis]KAI5959662.1 MP65 [Candida margitis]
MLYKTIVSTALLAQALAAPLAINQQHQHHKHNEEKRAVHVVTQTNVVVVTLGSGDSTTTFTPVSAETPASSASQVTDAPQNQPTTTVSASSSSDDNDSSSSSASGSDSSSSSQSSSNVGSGGAKGVTYTPYADNGNCKTSSQISSEVAELSGFDIIRLYGVDCDQVAQVLQAKSSGQKIFAGIYDVSAISDGVQTISDAVKAHGSWSDIHTVSVGNELVNSGEASTSQIKSYVNEAKSALKSAGYTGSVVSVDTFIAVINNPELCDYSDYIAVNAHCFFDGGYSADQAGEWVLSQIQRVSSACGNSKNVLITETGWPSKGDSNNKAIPSKQNQESAIQSIKDTCGSASILFTAFNDLWKSDGAYNAEKYWGFLSN